MSSSIRERLERDNDIIQSIIDAVPPKYFFDHEVLDELQNSKVKRGDQECKSLSARNNFGVKAKHKRYRLNPLHRKTVSQIVQDLHRSDKSKATSEKQSWPIRNNIDDLQERLRKKIQIMQEQRHAPGNKQGILMKRNEESLKEKKKNKKNRMYLKGKVVVGGGQTKEVKPQTTNLFNKDGKLIYSKFDLGTFESGKEKNNKSLKRSMQVVEERKEKLNKLDADTAKQVEKKEMWKQALKKSEGVKIRDNAELIKKTLKKRDQRRKKSGKEWQARNENVEKKQQQRQEKRKKNIQARKDSKLNKKLKKAAKKGRLIPGF